MALQSTGQKGILLAFLFPNDLRKQAWTQILTAAVSGNLPAIFVVLPQSAPSVDPAAIAHACSLPAIPVDAGDPIAIYRVAQESITRARAGGGPALIAGTFFPANSAFELTDPLFLLSSQLIARKVCTPRWLDKVNQRL
jgi:hypothetical protein